MSGPDASESLRIAFVYDAVYPWEKGEFPDAFLGAALLPGEYGVVNEGNLHRYLLCNHRIIQLRNLVAHLSQEFLDCIWI